MSPTPTASARRSKRLHLRLPVVVCVESASGNATREEHLTIAINAHGALLPIQTKVKVGQKITLMNPTTWDDQEARVKFVTKASDGLSRIGIEFLRPSPKFWPLGNLPEDWSNDSNTNESLTVPIAAAHAVGQEPC
jgi:hypothetical protein